MRAFKIIDTDGELHVEFGEDTIEPLDVTEGGHATIECDLAKLNECNPAGIPERLNLRLHSSDGFGTYFFHEMEISRENDKIHAYYIAHTPNKYWEGRFGLATFIQAIQQQAKNYDSLTVVQTETDDDWKGITISIPLAGEDCIAQQVSIGAATLSKLLKEAEIALSGLAWKPEHFTDEDLFCREILYPLFRRMGFLTVRYTHGKKEYGKDFTFSELTPFLGMRHYGVQAKAGDVSGKVNSAVDELLGQIRDAFEMPYYSLGSREPQYISTFIIAISGRFKENAREKIAEKTPKGLIGSVLFLDREAIDELIEKHWKHKA